MTVQELWSAVARKRKVDPENNGTTKGTENQGDREFSRDEEVEEETYTGRRGKTGEQKVIYVIYISISDIERFLVVCTAIFKKNLSLI